MALFIDTATPRQLLADFDAKLAVGHQAGGIVTWQKIGNDYTHKAAEWAKLAYFEPTILTTGIRFNIIKNQSTDITIVVYGFYHGHLSETFLNHFDHDFSFSRATALPTPDDHVS